MGAPNLFCGIADSAVCRYILLYSIQLHISVRGEDANPVHFVSVSNMVKLVMPHALSIFHAKLASRHKQTSPARCSSGSFDKR